MINKEKIKILICFLVCLFPVLSLSYNFDDEVSNNYRPIGNSIFRVVPTQYFSIKIEEISLNTEERDATNASKAVGGGVLLALENTSSIVHINSYGVSTILNLQKAKLANNFLPKLDTGYEDLKNTKFYNIIETYPRVLGAVSFGGNIYASYNYYDKAKDRIFFCISKISLVDRKWVEIFRTLPVDARYFALGNGGKLSIFDGKLFFTVGDQSLDRSNGLPSDFAAQNWKMPWGKVMYFPINMNPIKPSVCSVGHRNPQGLFINSKGLIYETEHGPRGGDEINLIKCGNNYGWPYFSYGTSYWAYGSSFPQKPQGFYEKISQIFSSKYIDPIYFFTPSPALSSLIQIENFSKEWDGDLLLGSLKATSIYRVKLSDVNRVQNVEQINLNSRIRDVVQMGNKIILLTDANMLLVLSKSDSPLFPGPTYPALNGCLGCHVLNLSSKNSFAPTLKNVYGSKLGASDYDYSLAFNLNKNIIWSEENLRQFLLNPQKFIPGTKMPAMNYKIDYVNDVIKELKTLKNNQN